MTQPQPDNQPDNQAGSLADSQPDSLADYYPLSHAEHALAAYDRQGETRLLEYVKEHALREESPEGQTAAATSYKGRRWFFNDDSVVWLHDPWWRETTREDAGMAESEENDGDVPPKYRFTWRYGNTERVVTERPAGRDFPRLDEAQLSYTQRAYQLLTEDGEVALLDFLLEHGDCANQPREDDIAQNQWECRVFIFPDHSLVEMAEGINKEWKFAEANMSHSVPMADSVEEELPDDPPVNRPLFNNWPTTRSTMKEALLNLENQVRQEMNLPLVSNWSATTSGRWNRWSASSRPIPGTGDYSKP